MTEIKIDLPTERWSVIRVALRNDSQPTRDLVLLDGWWADDDGNGWGDFSAFKNVEVLRVGIGDPAAPSVVGGLRDALIRLTTKWDDMDTPGLASPENQEWAKGVDNGYSIAASELRDLLAAHPPEPAPVASHERVAEALAKHLIAADGEYGGDWESPQHRAAYLKAARPYADALLAAGVFRDEAQAKAEALEEVAEYRHGITRTRGDFTDKFLRRWADQFRAGGPS